ncbi:MAG: glycerol dehydrogenase [Thermodesulfobacteriota bacterium]
MTRVYAGPERYVQGPGALDKLGEYAGAFSDSAVLVIGNTAKTLHGEHLAAIFEQSDIRLKQVVFSGEITREAVDAMAEDCRQARPGIVIAMGGGKVLDAGKAVARRLELPYITVPTIASNDSPASHLAIIYNDQHAVVAVERLARMPEVVLVDTALIAASPVHFLRQGIGDAISKSFEVEGCWQGGGKNFFGTRPLLTARAIAECCYQTLRAHAKAAIGAVERKEVNEDLEAVVEAAVLMSALAFENGGISVAHAITTGLAAARGAAKASHGEQVAYGLLVHLAAEERTDDFIEDLMSFYREIGLPVTLAELGLRDPTTDEINEIARLSMKGGFAKNLQRPVDQEILAASIRRIEALAM